MIKWQDHWGFQFAMRRTGKGLKQRSEEEGKNCGTVRNFTVEFNDINEPSWQR